MNINLTAIVAAVSTLSIISAVNAAAILPGDLVVYRVGDGSATLSNAATSVFLDEYAPLGGVAIQSIALPSTGTTAFTAVGTATSEGIISPSNDGSSLVYGGYTKAVGGANPSADAGTVTNRLIGSISSAGNPTQVASITDIAAGVTMRSAVFNGSAYYVATSTQVRYAGTGGSGITSTLIETKNSRQVFSAFGTVYGSSGSTTALSKAVSYGVTPTAATAGTAITPATTDPYNGIYFVDESATVAGVDTLYLVDIVAASTLQKYSFNGTSWSAAGSVSVASGVANLAVSYNAVTGAATVYLTSPSTIYSLTDVSGYGGTLIGTPVSIATAGTNTAFRGIGILPAQVLPEPTTLAAVGMLGALIRRRRTA